MLIKFWDDDKEFSICQYDQSQNVFSIFDKLKQNRIEYQPVLDLKKEYDHKNFDLILLNNERDDCTENSIFQVYIKEQRIGWLFPVQAILSKEHDYADNVYFLRYAYIAVCKLLDKIEDVDNKSYNSEIRLEDYYSENRIILLLDKENYGKLDNFSLDDYTVSLFKYGYSFKGRGNLISVVDVADKRINLVKQSEYLKKVPYIETMFKNNIPLVEEEFTKFHTYYQIIEILISFVFENKFNNFVSKLQAEIESLFDMKDDLNEMTSEKKRVVWLFDNYVKIEADDRRILEQKCKELLLENNKKVSNNCAENLYSVRCLLVHRLYVLTDKSYEILREINSTFLNVIMDMILSFEMPLRQ